MKDKAVIFCTKMIVKKCYGRYCLYGFGVFYSVVLEKMLFKSLN